MSDNPVGRVDDENLNFSRLLKELLKGGILVASCTGVGSFTIGPAGGFLGAAVGSVLTLVNAQSAVQALSTMAQNPLVMIVMAFLERRLISLGASRLWALVVRLAKFISEMTGKMQLKSLTHNSA